MGRKLTSKGLQKMVEEEARVTLEIPSLGKEKTGTIKRKKKDTYFVGIYKVKEGMDLRRAYFPSEDSGSDKHRYTGKVETFTVNFE